MTAFLAVTRCGSFLSGEDAQRLLAEVLNANPALADEQITPVSVKLLKALRSLAADKTPGHADSFVMHAPNERSRRHLERRLGAPQFGLGIRGGTHRVKRRWWPACKYRPRYVKESER